MTEFTSSSTSSVSRGPVHRDALPPGTRLDEFEIQHTLGAGGFGIVYQAFDHTLLRKVAIKEYMPSAIASRGQSRALQVRQTDQEGAYRAGLASFMAEARLLARFDHPSLVKVFRFWEAHNTAYMVMPLYEGRTLNQVREQAGRPPPDAWLRSLLMEIGSALQVLHAQGVMHRDISPDNIFLQEQGPPVLLDFGAARHAIEGHAQQMTAVLKVHYAPIEQYAGGDTPLQQGPWSDLYALGAVVHTCITQQPPQPSTHRAVHDQLPSFAQLAATVRREFGVEYSPALVGVLDAMMALRPEDRPANVADVLERLQKGDENERLNQAAVRCAWGAGWSSHAAQPTLDLLLESAQDEDLGFAPTQLPEVEAPLQSTIDIDLLAEKIQAPGAAPQPEKFMADSDEAQAKPSSEAKVVSAPATSSRTSKKSPTPSRASAVQRKSRWVWGVAVGALLAVVAAGVWLGSSSNPVRTESVLHTPSTLPTATTEQATDSELLTEQAHESQWVDSAETTTTGAPGAIQASGPAFVQSGDARGVTRQIQQVTRPVAVEWTPPSSPPVRPSEPAATARSGAPAASQSAGSGVGLCSDVGFFKRSACLEVECQKPANAGGAVCREVQKRVEQENSPYQN